MIAMGRKAGHLALGIGKAAGATLTLIPEEFAGEPLALKTIVDTLVGAIIKRLAYGRRDGVAIIAEGLTLALDRRGPGGLRRHRARRPRQPAHRRGEHGRAAEGEPSSAV